MQIPDYIRETVIETDQELNEKVLKIIEDVIPSDIILLGLSDLKKIGKNEFSVEGTNYTGEYYYQLEPIVKYRLDSATDKSRDIEIIALCTNKTLEEKSGTENCTAAEFFEKRVNDIKDECGYSGQVKLRKIRVLENDPIDGVAATVEYIRTKYAKQKADDINHYDFWIDTHGGFRDISLIIEAVISLLEVDGIIPDRIFGIRYADNKPAKLVDQSNSFLIFDFVSGMNEFFSFGRSKKLTDYYEAIGIKKNSFLPLINDISDAIQLCDIEEFDKAVKRLNEEYIVPREEKKKNRIPFDSNTNTNTYEEIFVELIKKSFGKLMHSDRERNKVVNKIEWCLENDFLQQALTIIESQMPEEFERRNIVFYQYDHKETKENNVYRKGADGSKQPIGRIELKKAISNRKPYWEKSINYALINWIRYVLCERDSNNKPVNPELGIYKRSYNLPEDLFHGNVRLWNVEETNDSEYHYIEYSLGINKKISSQQQNKEMLARLMLLHMALKDQRNATNHASNAERVTVDEVKNAIKAYIDYTRQIFDLVGIR